ncbi:MAG: hypothetical protein QF567_01325 [Candidatus Pacearchaeota archaeon]|nr:hypothetical protein [Candidatus Pacearchaeota archaeon]
MVVIKGVAAKSILDSRKDKTILITVKTSIGNFSASSPNGKSTGKHAVKIYKKNLEEDIKTIKKFSDYFSKEIIDEFDDLRRIEDIVDGHVGANTLFALESAILKATAKEQKKQIWELINLKSRKTPRLVGNCIGGGKHSNSRKKPDFQEFLIIPNLKSTKESFEKSKEVKKDIKEILKRVDKNFENKKNDEDAWMTLLNEKEILDILKKIKLPLGVDIASSSFYKRNKYNYENPLLKRDSKEQLGYLSNLINNYNLEINRSIALK